MAQKGIREYHAKKMLSKYLKDFTNNCSYDGKIVLVDANVDWNKLIKDNPWLNESKLVVKPDQLFGKRGKHNLILLNSNLNDSKKWIESRMNQTCTVGKTTGTLTHFIIEPFVPHKEEYYVAIKSFRDCDSIYFSTEGGINVEENWDKVTQIDVPIGKSIDDIEMKSVVKSDMIESFIRGLYRFYNKLHYSYLELNPFTIVDNRHLVPLDTVARLDDTAAFECSSLWGDIEFPSPFGRTLSAEERYIEELDSKTGASLKLTVLNPRGRIWTMVAGGGASVIFADTVVDLGHKDDLANYGEYSGDPSQELTHEYAKTILDLMTRDTDPKGKVLLIGGGIANFTDVAKTFTGIIDALKIYADKLKKNKISIFVRRGGPNYKEGLDKMSAVGKQIGVPIEVYGPETHMTKIVTLAIKAL